MPLWKMINNGPPAHRSAYENRLAETGGTCLATDAGGDRQHFVSAVGFDIERPKHHGGLTLIVSAKALS